MNNLLGVLLLFQVANQSLTIQPIDKKLSFAMEQSASNPDTAFFVAKLIHIKASKDKDAYLQAKSSLVLGEILFYQGDFEESTAYLLEAQNLFSELRDDTWLAKTKLNLGTVYQYSKQYILAKNYIQEALEIYKSNENINGIAISYGALGQYYEKLGELDTAITIQHRALYLLESGSNSKKDLADLYNNLGSLYEDKEVYDSAQWYFNKALKTNDELQRINEKLVALNNIGDVYRKTTQYSLAHQMVDSVINLSKKNHIKYQLRSGFKDKSKIYALQEDYKMSYFYLDSAANLYKELINSSAMNRMAHMKFIYESDLKEQKIATLEKEQSINSRIKALMMSLLLVLIVAGYLIFQNLRLKLKNNKKLLEQKEKLVVTEQELLVADLKNSLLNEQNLKNEIHNRELVEKQLREDLSQKSQALTSHALSLIRKNNFLEEVQEELKVIKTMPRQELKKSMNKLLANIKMNFVHEDDWNEFQRNFEEIHLDFFTKLKQNFPDLSPTDLRLCALLKMNLNSADIATILGISPDSLRVARYRLRKKIDIEKGEGLVSYLLTLT